MSTQEAYQKALNEGHSAAWDQDWGKAVECYRRAVLEYPEQPKALNSLGLALYQLGRFDEALETYQRVAQMAPNDPLPLEKVAQLSERVGDVPAAVSASMRAAEAFLSQQDLEKAVENWIRVTSLQPEQALAHGRLATAYERQGHRERAVTEYLAVASLLQRSGSMQKAEEVVAKAALLAPESPEVRQAQSLLKTGQLLPAPLRTHGGTATLRLAQVKQLQDSHGSAAPELEPVAEAMQKALTQLAEILFDYGPEAIGTQERHGLVSILKGTGQVSTQNAEQSKVILHLGQAIDAQTKGQDAAAADELERALEAGFDQPVLHFSLGALRLRLGRQESAIRHLARALTHEDYGLASRLLLGDILFTKNLFKDASIEYIEALKMADASTVPAAEADEVRESYEPYLEAQQGQQDGEVCRQLCENVRGLLLRPDWRQQVLNSRHQGNSADRSGFSPLAEVMLAAQSLGVVESINRVHELARAGNLRSAMDEAFSALQRAPNYLPLHSLMADLLIDEDRVPEAIAKLSVVARAYATRGEVSQSTKIWRRVTELAPMDMSARAQLIDMLVERGQTEEAIREYMELAEVYYRLAELDMARKTYTTALHLVQTSNADRSWNVSILQRMGDIDMQHLDWKQAVRVYEQIRTLRPDDQTVRRQLIDLHTRMAQPQLATAELDAYLTFLESNSRSAEAIPFLEELIQEHTEQTMYTSALAAQLHRLGRTAEAVERLDALGEQLLQANRKPEAVEVIRQIITMNPPNAAEYQKVLAQIAA
ncbi:MAG TPA: tetratricopeptide repeat protein [Anaerolineales bacterium]|nr:tetratricopeptide repeat protein [Anaerolineales bacterium]